MALVSSGMVTLHPNTNIDMPPVAVVFQPVNLTAQDYQGNDEYQTHDKQADEEEDETTFVCLYHMLQLTSDTLK